MNHKYNPVIAIISFKKINLSRSKTPSIQGQKETSETEGTDVGDEKQRENQPKPQRWSRTKPLRKQGHRVGGLI